MQMELNRISDVREFWKISQPCKFRLELYKENRQRLLSFLWDQRVHSADIGAETLSSFSILMQIRSRSTKAHFDLLTRLSELDAQSLDSRLDNAPTEREAV